MRLLAIDSSSDQLSVALADGPLIRQYSEAAGSHSGQRALPMVVALLGESGLRGSDLDAIAFGAGPGGFTGLRIACGIAQGLAEAWGISVVPVSSLLAAAESVRLARGLDVFRAVVAFDARMGEIYIASASFEAGDWRWRSPPAVAAPGAAQIPSDPGWFAVGSGFLAYPELLERLTTPQGAETGAQLRTGEAILGLARKSLEREPGIDPALARPDYLRDKVALTLAERRRSRTGRSPAG